MSDLKSEVSALQASDVRVGADVAVAVEGVPLLVMEA